MLGGTWVWPSTCSGSSSRLCAVTDRDYMRLALDLAGRARLTARPNPMVGAVVVKDGQIVGSGYHHRPGERHGEVEALRDVPDELAEGSTVYVNLEPCSFVGRTGACSKLLVDRRVARVVCAIEDPDTRVSGQGFAHLREEDIQVDVGELELEARQLNSAYLMHREQGRPLVTLKLAQSLDGSIATAGGDSKWITGPAARRRGHALRAEAQAIIVGIGTVLADDPELTCRHVDGDDPVKVILDNQARTPTDAKVLSGNRCIVCKTASAPVDRKTALEDAGAEVWTYGEASVDLRSVLERMAEEDMIHLLVEGGARVAGSFLQEGLVDRLALFSAPKLVGGLSSVDGLQLDSIGEAFQLADLAVERLGPDVLVTGNVLNP